VLLIGLLFILYLFYLYFLFLFYCSLVGSIDFARPDLGLNNKTPISLNPPALYFRCT
jgi:hypothetical protein